MYPDSWIYCSFTSCNFDLWWKQNGGQDNDLRKTTCFKLIFLCTDGFNSEILLRNFVMQCKILINVNIFIAYLLTLSLNTQRPHYRSQCAGKWNLILAHDSRPIYRASTYIAVPLLGSHQPRYIESTLYHLIISFSSSNPFPTFCRISSVIPATSAGRSAFSGPSAYDCNRNKPYTTRSSFYHRLLYYYKSNVSYKDYSIKIK